MRERGRGECKGDNRDDGKREWKERVGGRKGKENGWGRKGGGSGKG